MFLLRERIWAHFRLNDQSFLLNSFSLCDCLSKFKTQFSAKQHESRQCVATCAWEQAVLTLVSPCCCLVNRDVEKQELSSAYPEGADTTSQLKNDSILRGACSLFWFVYFSNFFLFVNQFSNHRLLLFWSKPVRH